MHEIKYRALVLNTNNWIYRQPFHIRGTWYMYNSLWDKVPINHKTIGRHTTVKDTRSREVYDGDIIQYPWSDGNYQVISYVDGSDPANLGMEIGFYVQRNNFESYSMLEVGEQDFEVVGNVYEDAHLLNDK